MEITKTTMPLHLQIYQDLLKKITDGEWKTDDKLPPELELCKIYSVSRITIRQAMDKLKEQGYIKRVPGRGSFVSLPPMEQKLNSFYSFGDRISSKGQPVGSHILQYRRETADSKIAKILEITPGDTIIYMERIRLMDSIPFAHEISRFPLKYFPQITREMIQENGLYKSFRLCSNVNPDIAEETFEAVPMGSKIADYLKVSANSPAMRINRIAKYNGIIIEQCTSIVRGDRLKYNVIMPRQTAR